MYIICIYYLVPFVNDRDFENILPNCPYEPSYLVKRKLKRYEGINHVSPYDI